MKFLVVFALVVVAAMAAPVEVTRNEFDNIGIDGYKFAYVKLSTMLTKVISKNKAFIYFPLTASSKTTDRNEKRQLSSTI